MLSTTDGHSCVQGMRVASKRSTRRALASPPVGVRGPAVAGAAFLGDAWRSVAWHGIARPCL
eukprot:1232429-Pyramimonas_sp.AAC.1